MKTLPEMLNIACVAYGEPPGGGMAHQHIVRRVVGERWSRLVVAWPVNTLFVRSLARSWN
jgi:hypothetical protein